MGIVENNIQFTVVEDGSEQIIETYIGEYRSLMALLKDELYLDSFGECGGVGRCATCIVKTSGISGNSSIKDRNEPVTLSKMGYEEENVRLSCQLMITKDLEGSCIEIIG
ncbi:MAG: 2Fe-2S iron-sulfur cluster binding domain-containing protein [Flavobacteriaceae bacterium]|nr:2Fe-2S iron-sulfur cluster binding domain-containing protein [Flavobacteriaceae bacterium]